jgi:hypothetical protein
MKPLVVLAVTVEHVDGSTAAHVRAVVAAAGVVAVEPALELGVELVESVEALAVECWPMELLQRGALEPFADRVVVR